jgi:molecular chaperone HtpG
VTITDNGSGIPERDFLLRLTSFGGSAKRGKRNRGFRGVGRLAGLGYCQELIFRSRSAGEIFVNELRWDCRTLKTILRDASSKNDLATTVRQVVTKRRLRKDDIVGSFFQVELKGVIRHRNDQILSEAAIANYLSQVAPVPFGEEFSQQSDILTHIRETVQLGNLEISINGSSPIRRPFQTVFQISDHEQDCFGEVEPITVPAVDGELAAVGWVAHHGYRGALSTSLGIRGIRFRVGNIQIGDDRLVEELFPEQRFNAWSVGEIHIVDPRILPNGRRDNFDHNVHFDNLLNHLAPVARKIARQCRLSSTHRKYEREFAIRLTKAKETLAIIKQAAVSKAELQKMGQKLESDLSRLAEILDAQLLPEVTSQELRAQLQSFNREASRKLTAAKKPGPLDRLSGPKRRAFEQIIELIYQCSTNQSAARSLVDKVLSKIE